MKKMGRPRKAKDKKQSAHLSVYLTPMERDTLGKLARQKGLSLASLIMLPWRQGNRLEG